MQTFGLQVMQVGLRTCAGCPQPSRVARAISSRCDSDRDSSPGRPAGPRLSRASDFGKGRMSMVSWSRALYPFFLNFLEFS